MTSSDTRTGTAIIVPTSHYTMQALVNIYNQTRVDYIVPMPMNEKRLADYVRDYDVDLDASIVTLNSEKQITGISMLGMRDERAWITRLGVLPVKRRHGTGQLIMDNHIETARASNVRYIQLEVIKNNIPAHRLFLKNGFEETRELLVIRRPPGPLPQLNGIDRAVEVSVLGTDEIMQILENEDDPTAAWTEETISLLNAGGLMGLRVHTQDGLSAYVIYQFTLLQLTHFRFDPAARDDHDLICNLIFHVHARHPQHDVKIENVAVNDLLWQAYQRMGYVEAFRRIEMILHL